MIEVVVCDDCRRPLFVNGHPRNFCGHSGRGTLTEFVRKDSAKVTTFERVRRFHELAGHPIAGRPGQIPLRRRELRIRLLIEEFTELLEELLPSERGRAWAEGMRMEMLDDFLLYVFEDDRVDLAALAKEMADVDVVVAGTAIEYGIPHDETTAAVCDSNDAKAGGPRRADGKTLKPDGWQPPDLRVILEAV